MAEDLQLSGQVELSSPSLRRVARWFGVPVPIADGLNAVAVKGQVNWARHAFAVEDAKVVIDGNEAAGALVLNLAGERPLIDATLAFHALDLTPYAEAARSQSFLFDRQTATWSLFDLSFPLIRHVDADLRISAPKVALKGFGLGRGAATIAVRSGKLLADIAELDLYRRQGERARSPPTPTRSCRATRCAAGSRTSTRVRPARPCSAPRC